MNDLGPLWRYFGGKYRTAPHYPPPRHGTIVEPFAGAAGYALRYPDRRVILVERNPVIASLWRYLIKASARDIRSIPEVEHVDELPSRVPEGARALVGFALNSGSVMPRLSLSAGRRTMRSMGRRYEGWTAAQRERVAQRVGQIRHWRIIEGDYTDAPRVTATWFVDPPYEEAGKHYPHQIQDFSQLGRWCRGLPGQVLVCENVGASWLPFRPFRVVKSGLSKRTSHEALWTNAELPPRLPGMADQIQEILSSLTAAIKEQVRAEVRAELIAELGGGKPAAPRGKPGPKPKAIKARQPEGSEVLRVKKGARRTPEEVEQAANVIRQWFKANPESRIDQASAALGVPVKDLQRPVQLLLEQKKLATVRGTKLRGTKYTVKG